MSTKTSFKRIALVAVSALGFGLLSVVPASALADEAANLTVFAASPTTATAVAGTATIEVFVGASATLTTGDGFTVIPTNTTRPAGSSAPTISLTSTGAAAPFATSGTVAETSVLTTSGAGLQSTAQGTSGGTLGTITGGVGTKIGTLTVTGFDAPGIYTVTITPDGAGTDTAAVVTIPVGYSADPLRTNRAFPTQGSNVTTGWAATAGGQATVRITNFPTASARTYYVTTDSGSIIAGTEADTGNDLGAIAFTNGVNMAGGFNFAHDGSGSASAAMNVTITDLGATTTTVSVKYFDAATGVATTFAAATVTWGVAAAASTQYSLCTLNAGAGTTATGSAADTLSTSVSKAVAAAKNFTIQVVVKDQYNAALNAKTIAAVITGPGLIGIADGNAAGAATGRAVSQLLTNNAGSVSVWADGSTGTSTITISVGTTTLCSKTVTFVGSPTTATATQNLHIAKKGTTLGATPSTTDGTNDGTTYLLTPAFTVNVTDADGNDVMAGSTVKMVSSDTSVITVGTCAENSTYSGNFECSVAGAVGAATGASATVTFYVYNAATAAYDIATDALTFKIGSGTIGTETMTLDAASYDPGAAMVLTMKAVDAAGNPVADGTASRVPTANKSVVGLPTAAKWYVNGERVYKTSLYAPATEGSFTVKATSGNAAADTVSVSANVNGGASAAAAEAASDAALEAIDAANAATDAANLAAEAADAATVAAEEARDAADAATAAVEALASEVATLMAALKAQLTTLAKTVAKIAKKVKA